METLKRWWNIALDAFWQFNADDGWAIASHIALSGLMSLFPFFLVLTAVAGIIGSTDLASEAARLVLEAWPQEVSGPIALEIQHVLEGAMVMSDGVILPVHLPPAIQQATAQPPAAAAPVLAGPLDEALETWERQMILDALRQGGGIQARAAKILGISERSLWYRVKKLGIQVRTQPEA